MPEIVGRFICGVFSLSGEDHDGCRSRFPGSELYASADQIKQTTKMMMSTFCCCSTEAYPQARRLVVGSALHGAFDCARSRWSFLRSPRLPAARVRPLHSLKKRPGRLNPTSLARWRRHPRSETPPTSGVRRECSPK